MTESNKLGKMAAAVQLAGSAMVETLVIECSSDTAQVIKAIRAFLPDVTSGFLPDTPHCATGFGLQGITLPQALVVEAILRAQDHDYVAQYGKFRFFRMEPGLATWHKLTGERDAPASWDTTLLQVALKN